MFKSTLLSFLIVLAGCGGGIDGTATHPALALQESSTPNPVQLPVAVLLCQYNDNPATPRSLDYYRKLFVGLGTGGLSDYWLANSFGNVDLVGSTVSGWYTIPVSQSQAPVKRPGNGVSECLDAAFNASGIDYSVYSAVVVMFNVGGADVGAAGTVQKTYNGRVMNIPIITACPNGGDNDTFLAHEMGHELFGLPHSFDQTQSLCGGAPGEYCDWWDIMSAFNVGSYADSLTGLAGPSMAAPYRERLGWLPPDRVYNYDGNYETVRLAPINHPELSGYVALRAPLSDGRHYLVELRRADGWDQGIGTDAVLIHEVRTDDISYLARSSSPNNAWQPGSTYTDAASGLTINVGAIAYSNGVAQSVDIRFGNTHCVPATTCSGNRCGAVSDGCGGSVNCTCSAGLECSFGSCIDQSCLPKHCPKHTYWDATDCACEPIQMCGNVPC